MPPISVVRLLFLLLLPATLNAQDTRKKATVHARVATSVSFDGKTPLPLKYVGPPTAAAITAGDLMTRLYKFADDSMMGREAGSIWNDKGTDYIASELKRLGIKPAGENGTYFQQVIVKRELDPSSALAVNGTNFTVWKDFLPRDQGPSVRAFDGATAVWGGTFGDTNSYIAPADVAGRIVVMRVGNGPDGTPGYLQINRNLLSQRYRDAAAIAVVALDWTPPDYLEKIHRSAALGKRNTGPAAPMVPAYFYVTRAVADAMLGTSSDSARTGTVGKPVNGALKFTETAAPGRNVIGIIEGADPKLKHEYVAIGAHNDHVGFNHTPLDHDSLKAFTMIAAPQGADNGPHTVTPEEMTRINAIKDSLRAIYPARPDSIYNGADDDGSGSMGVLEIAERYARATTRPKRSLLFVWHTGEEEGTLGSNVFTDLPTVPRDSIVAQLNVDMIGRGASTDVTGEDKAGAPLHGGPGYLQLIGSRRNSTELGDLLETVNTTQQHGLTFDYALDANGHPQNIYCRSDHYEYARFGIPIAFFTTGGHADYHQVTDEPQYINYGNYVRVTNFIDAVATKLANLDHRPVVDKPKPDPYGACKQ